MRGAGPRSDVIVRASRTSSLAPDFGPFNASQTRRFALPSPPEASRNSCVQIERTV